MSTPHAKQANTMFDLLERCQTVLADAFPHEGLRAIGGSRIMLRDPLLAVLKECFKDIQNELQNQPDSQGRSELAALWAEASQLLARIEKRGGEENAEEINKAATLLYLTSGTTWNYLREIVADEPRHNPQYVRIEPMLPLLKCCGLEGRAGSDAHPKQMVERLCAELSACLG